MPLKSVVVHAHGGRISLSEMRHSWQSVCFQLKSSPRSQEVDFECVGRLHTASSTRAPFGPDISAVVGHDSQLHCEASHYRPFLFALAPYTSRIAGAEGASSCISCALSNKEAHRVPSLHRLLLQNAQSSVLLPMLTKAQVWQSRPLHWHRLHQSTHTRPESTLRAVSGEASTWTPSLLIASVRS